MRIFLALYIVLTLGACGGNRTGSSGEQGPFQPGSNTCSLQFMDDYKLVARSLIFSGSTKDLDDTQTMVNNFGAKYKGVICDAFIRSADHPEPMLTIINTDNKVDEWTTTIRSSRKRMTASATP